MADRAISAIVMPDAGLARAPPVVILLGYQRPHLSMGVTAWGIVIVLIVLASCGVGD